MVLRPWVPAKNRLVDDVTAGRVTVAGPVFRGSVPDNDVVTAAVPWNGTRHVPVNRPMPVGDGAAVNRWVHFAMQPALKTARGHGKVSGRPGQMRSSVGQMVTAFDTIQGRLKKANLSGPASSRGVFQVVQKATDQGPVHTGHRIARQHIGVVQHRPTHRRGRRRPIAQGQLSDRQAHQLRRPVRMSVEASFKSANGMQVATPVQPHPAVEGGRLLTMAVSVAMVAGVVDVRRAAFVPPGGSAGRRLARVPPFRMNTAVGRAGGLFVPFGGPAVRNPDFGSDPMAVDDPEPNPEALMSEAQVQRPPYRVPRLRCGGEGGQECAGRHPDGRPCYVKADHESISLCVRWWDAVRR